MSQDSITSFSGLMINSPSFLPTLTSEIGPSNGISETVNAAEAANPAKLSGIFTPSKLINEISIWVSQW